MSQAGLSGHARDHKALARTTLGVFMAGPVGVFLASALYFAIMFLPKGIAPSLSDLPRGVSSLSYIAINIGFTLGLPVMIFGGLPMHAFLYALRLRTWWTYAIAGALVGVAVSAASFFTYASGNDELFHEVFGVFALTGALCALTFWCIRRPDLDDAISVPRPQAQPDSTGGQ